MSPRSIPVLDTDFDTPNASPGFLLWQISNKWQALQRAALQPFNLTHVQFVLLASLTWSEHQEPMTQKQLATHAQTDVMMTSQVIRTLEAKGLVTRLRDAKDRRAIILRPTPKGVELANKTVQAVEAVDRQFFGKLGSDQASFTRYLQQLAHLME